jgi:hypothetical protein
LLYFAIVLFAPPKENAYDEGRTADGVRPSFVLFASGVEDVVVGRGVVIAKTVVFTLLSIDQFAVAAVNFICKDVYTRCPLHTAGIYGFCVKTGVFLASRCNIGAQGKIFKNDIRFAVCFLHFFPPYLLPQRLSKNPVIRSFTTLVMLVYCLVTVTVLTMGWLAKFSLL